jgi:hypothetical protein
MISDTTLLWATVGLFFFLAFVLLPTYERFVDKNGKETDVDPNAPPMPDWLKPIDERTGKREKYTNILGDAPPVPTKDPLPAPGWLAPGGNEPDYLKREGMANWFVWPIRETFDLANPGAEPLPEPELPQSTTVTALPPPVTIDSNKPSGVKTIPSQSMPPNTLLQDVNKAVGTDKKVTQRTLPAPDFSGDQYGPGNARDKYVLKSSLPPCSCPTQGMSCPQHGGSYPGSRVPGSIEMNEDDMIQKPFSVAYPGETDPVGYLNSFSAFTK